MFARLIDLATHEALGLLCKLNVLGNTVGEGSLKMYAFYESN